MQILGCRTAAINVEDGEQFGESYSFDLQLYRIAKAFWGQDGTFKWCNEDSSEPISADACTKEGSVDSVDHLELLTQQPKSGVSRCLLPLPQIQQGQYKASRGSRGEVERGVGKGRLSIPSVGKRDCAARRSDLLIVEITDGASNLEL